jgi:alcohol dehydrogenase
MRFGAGRIAELGDACKIAGMSRPLLVTDPFLATQPMTERTLGILAEAGLKAAMFSDIRPNPVETNVAKGLEVLRAGGHDGVVAFGGGSALDAGKVIAFMAGQTRPMWDFEDIGDWWTRADPKGIRPIVAVPTTAGTGSEVGRAGVITQEATHTKKVIFHPLMMPKVTICDPELTVGMPPHITAGTGLDALAHCLEAYCAPAYHPMAEGIGVEGIRLVKEYLPRAYRDGTDIEARAHMMSAAAMGATAFQKGLGAIHSLSHPIGAFYDTHHGTTNAVFMPAVLRFNRSAIEPRVARMAAYCGIEGGFDGFFAAVLALRSALNIPATVTALLGGKTLSEDEKTRMAEMAVVDPTAGGNPVPITVEAARRILDEAIEGEAGRGA